MFPSLLISSVLISVLISVANCADNSKLVKYFKPAYNKYEPKPTTNVSTKSVQDELSARLFHFMVGGLSDIVWSRIPEIILTQRDSDNQPRKEKIGHECLDSLRFVIDGIDKGFMSAFQIIDASAKKPIGIIDGTLSFWGDYDQCLAIEGINFTGKYCPINIMPLTYRHLNNNAKYSDILHLDECPLKSMGFFFGLCFPSKCSNSDIEILIQDSIHDYPIELNLFSCETYSDIKYLNRIYNLTWLQIFSLLIFFGAMYQVLWTSLYDILIRFSIINPNIYVETYLQLVLDIFSGYRNMVRIFYIKKCRNENGKFENSEKSSFIDYFKLWILFLGIAGHVGYNLDSPFGVYLIGHHKILVSTIGDFLSQPFLNETRTCLMNFFAGLITFSITSVAISKKKSFSYIGAVIDKYFRHAPAIFGLLVIEFIWPLLFSGPLYSIHGEYSYEKCSKMWIQNLALLGNVGNTNGLETCISHTYYSGVDFQLYVIGIFVVTMLIESPRKGILISIALILFGNIFMASKIYFNEMEPVLITKNLEPMKMSQYFDTFHLSTFSYLSPYFTGVLLSYFISNCGYKFDMSSNIRRKFWLIFGVSLYICADFSTALYNTFEIIPKWFNPIFVLVPRWLYVCSASVMVVYSVSEKKAPKEEDSPSLNPGISTGKIVNETEFQKPKVDDSKSKSTEFEFDFFKGLSRLAFAIYIVNIWQIKLDFYTSTQIFENFHYQFFKRFIYISYFTLQTAFFFQLFFVAPADNVRHLIKFGQSKLDEYFPKLNEIRYKNVIKKGKSE